MKRDFYLNIGEDKVLLTSIEFDIETMTPTNTLLSNAFNTLSLSPLVIDISHLNYRPNVGDTWDGTNFINENGVSNGEKKDITQENTSFSFIVNGVHSHYWIFVGNGQTNMIIAALQSNPTITFEDTNV